MTSIEELVREAEQIEFCLSPESELEGVLRTLQAFQQESTRKLQDIQKQKHCDRSQQNGTEQDQYAEGQEKAEFGCDGLPGCDAKRQDDGAGIQAEGWRSQKHDNIKVPNYDPDKQEDGGRRQDNTKTLYDSVKIDNDGELLNDRNLEHRDANDERSEGHGGYSGEEGNSSDCEVKEAEKSLAEALQVLTCLNLLPDDTGVSKRYSGESQRRGRVAEATEHRAARPRILSLGLRASSPSHTSPASGEGAAEVGWPGSQRTPHLWRQVAEEPRESQPPHTRVRFDMNALNRELANLLTMTGEDPLMLEHSSLLNVPVTPPPTPVFNTNYAPEDQEYLPPFKIMPGPPPPKPPRVKFPANEIFHAQTGQLSKSTGNLAHEDSQRKHQSLSAHALSPGERKENILLASIKRKGMRARVRSFTKKKVKRVKSLDISGPTEFRHVAGALALKGVDAADDGGEHDSQPFTLVPETEEAGAHRQERIASETEDSQSTDTTSTETQTDDTGSTEAIPADGTSSIEETPTDDTNSTEATPTDGTSSIETTPTEGTSSTKSTPTDDTSSTEATPTDPIGNTGSTEATLTDPTDDTGSTEATPTDDTASTGATPTDNTGSTEATLTDPTDDTGSTEATPTDDTGSTEATPTDNGSTEATPTDNTGSTEATLTDPTDDIDLTEASPTDPIDNTGSTEATPTDDTASTEATPTEHTG
nr:nucleolar protein dao-5-like isoform X2 [Procambarus clarkii]